MWAGKYDAVEETLNPLYDQMSNHVMIQRKRLGGDMAIAQAVFSRRQRDKLRKIIGPDLVFIVLNMTKECQMKRIQGRHGDSPMQGPKKGLTDAAIMLCKLNKSL